MALRQCYYLFSSKCAKNRLEHKIRGKHQKNMAICYGSHKQKIAPSLAQWPFSSDHWPIGQWAIIISAMHSHLSMWCFRPIHSNLFQTHLSTSHQSINIFTFRQQIMYNGACNRFVLVEPSPQLGKSGRTMSSQAIRTMSQKKKSAYVAIWIRTMS